MPASQLVSFSALVWLIIVVAFKYVKAARRLPYPPGPRSWPILGNALDIPTAYQWLAFSRWSKKFGDIVHVNALGIHIVVLNSAQVANELFDKRGSLYSDRPHMPMFNELGLDSHIPFIDYGPWWRKHRRAFHQHFHSQVVLDKYQDVQCKEAYKLALQLLDTPDAFRDHLKHFAGSLMIRITYGFEVQKANDPWVRLSEAGVEGATEAGIPGTFLVDVFPFLKYFPSWFPGAGFQVLAARWRKAASDARDIPFRVVEKALVNGDTSSSFVSASLRNIEKDHADRVEEETLLRHYKTAADCMLAGVDTTAATLATFFAAMVMYPDVQRKAQAELDAVLGKHTLPTLVDKPRLPYIQAIVWEVLRWQPVLPIGIPHQINTDNEYRGYLIPKGTIVMGNSWAILHDERQYPEPHEFKPERFLKDGNVTREDESALYPGAAFGYGRRQCPGRHFASNALFIAIATILTCFDIRCPRDLEDKERPVRVEMTSGLASAPKEFPCTIELRVHRNALKKALDHGIEHFLRQS